MFVPWKLQAILQKKPSITCIFRRASWSSMLTWNKAQIILLCGYTNCYQAMKRWCKCISYTTIYHNLFVANKDVVYRYIRINKIKPIISKQRFCKSMCNRALICLQEEFEKASFTLRWWLLKIECFKCNNYCERLHSFSQ